MAGDGISPDIGDITSVVEFEAAVVSVGVVVGVRVAVSVDSAAEVVPVVFEDSFSGGSVSLSVVSTVVSLVLSVAVDDSTSLVEVFGDSGIDADLDTEALCAPLFAAHVKVTLTKASKNDPPRSSRPWVAGGLNVRVLVRPKREVN